MPATTRSRTAYRKAAVAAHNEFGITKADPLIYRRSGKTLPKIKTNSAPVFNPELHENEGTRRIQATFPSVDTGALFRDENNSIVFRCAHNSCSGIATGEPDELASPTNCHPIEFHYSWNKSIWAYTGPDGVKRWRDGHPVTPTYIHELHKSNAKYREVFWDFDNKLRYLDTLLLVPDDATDVLDEDRDPPRNYTPLPSPDYCPYSSYPQTPQTP